MSFRLGRPGKAAIVFLSLLISSALMTFSPTAGRAEMRPEAVLKSAENRKLSPFTGYTREHWLEICEKLIAGILPYLDPETGLPVLKGVPGETGHFKQEREFIGGRQEAFERSLMLAAIYTAATGKDRVPGYEGSISAPYLKGIICGTDPGDPAHWGKREQYDAFGTNIALAVLVSPKFFWEPLTPKQKENLLLFFEDLSKMVAYDCNHWYFHLAAIPVLQRYAQANPRREYLTAVFDRLLNWYRGDGWFIDGGNFTFDYYNLWGFQLYNNALCYFDSQWKGLYGERVKAATARFLESFRCLYGRDGGPIPVGRSLTYRFASLSAVGWAVLDGTCTLPPGEARRIASGCLKYFWDNGCLSANGLLEPGFYGPNSVVAESYIDRGSPYWAAQGLICLVIPESDPFWTAAEKPMPADGVGGRLALPGAEMTLKVSPVDGEARAYVIGEPVGHAGQWQRGIKYFQHSYSSYLGWCALGEGGPDLGAGRTGVSYDGKSWLYRTNPRPVQVDPYHCVSTWDFTLETPAKELEDFGRVVTHTLIGDNGEVHVFWHNSARPLYLYLGGYGISVPPGSEPSVQAQDNILYLNTGRYHSAIRTLQAPSGVLKVERLKPREGWSHAHLFGGEGAFPYWQSLSPVPPNTVVALYVNGTRDRVPPVPQISLQSGLGLLRVTLEGVTYQIETPY